MPSPSVVSQTTSFVQSSGNQLIDAMIGTKEGLVVQFAQRADLVGTTGVKWGAGLGTGANLTYSFFDASSAFPAQYPSQYTDEIGDVPDYLKDAHRLAFSEWSKYVNVSFQEVVETTSNVGDLRIGVSISNTNFRPGSVSAEAVPPAAQAFGIFPGLHAGDIFYSEALAQRPASGYAPGGFDFMTVMHEIAHAAFGFSDVSAVRGLQGEILPAELNYRSSTIMSYSVVPGATVGDGSGNEGGLSLAPTTPMVLDILAAQWLYGANTTFNDGNTTYNFAETNSFHETIWDAGGIDTISIRGNFRGGTLDLRPGSYSDVGSQIVASTASGNQILTKTVGIAFGTVIENAVGGSGSDILFGNGASNVLQANAGNDIVLAGGGNDYVEGADGADIMMGNPGSDTILGGAGDDIAYGGKDADFIYGNSGNDQLFGNLASDTLHGGQGDDLVHGGKGNDTLNGGAGNDVLFGGADADTFVFGVGKGRDVIADFNGLEGDRINGNGQTYAIYESSDGDVLIGWSGGGQAVLQDVKLPEFNEDWIV